MKTTDRTGVEMEALTAVSVARCTVRRHGQGRRQGRRDHRRAGPVEVRRQVGLGPISHSAIRRPAPSRDPRGRRGRLDWRRRRWLRRHDRSADRRGPSRGQFVGDPVVCPDGPAGRPPDRRGRGRRAPAGADVCGGTEQLTPTDRTPEVTRPLLDREVPGLAEAIRAAGVAKGVPTAVLSRGLAVLLDALVVNLPLGVGSQGRARRARAGARARGRAGRGERPLSTAANGSRRARGADGRRGPRPGLAQRADLRHRPRRPAAADQHARARAAGRSACGATRCGWPAGTRPHRRAPMPAR